MRKSNKKSDVGALELASREDFVGVESRKEKYNSIAKFKAFLLICKNHLINFYSGKIKIKKKSDADLNTANCRKKEGLANIAERQKAACKLGSIFQSKRLSLQMEIGDASLALRTKVKDVIALEAGNISDIEGYVYIPGLARSYANMLNIPFSQIEELVDLLPVKLNVDDKRYCLLNADKELELSPNYDLVLNSFLIFMLIFFGLLLFFNYQNNSGALISDQYLINQLKKIK